MNKIEKKKLIAYQIFLVAHLIILNINLGKTWQNWFWKFYEFDMEVILEWN